MPNLYARTLKRAAQIAGGTEQLALHFKVTPSHLALWIAGVEPTPAEIFLRAVDIVSEQGRDPSASSNRPTGSGTEAGS